MGPIFHGKSGPIEWAQQKKTNLPGTLSADPKPEGPMDPVPLFQCRTDEKRPNKRARRGQCLQGNSLKTGFVFGHENILPKTLWHRHIHTHEPYYS